MSLEIVTIADAVAVLDYLHKRELLCTHCGGKLVVWENAFHRRCDDCKSPNANYKKARIPNELERNIVAALNRWIALHSPDEGSGPNPDTSDSAGKPEAPKLHPKHVGPKL